MEFSSAEKAWAAKHGLQLGASLKANKIALLKQGWVLDKGWLADGEAEPVQDKEMVCGSGFDAVCQTAFRKNTVTLVLTLSAANDGTPLVGVEEVERGNPALGLARTLTTPSFIVRIKADCAEGNVACDDVSYVGTSRKSGNSIALRGKTIYSTCADRASPCRFAGYEFWNGETYYRVLDDGTLSVRQGDRLLLKERGRWEK